MSLLPNLHTAARKDFEGENCLCTQLAKALRGSVSHVTLAHVYHKTSSWVHTLQLTEKKTK